MHLLNRGFFTTLVCNIHSSLEPLIGFVCAVRTSLKIPSSLLLWIPHFPSSNPNHQPTLSLSLSMFRLRYDTFFFFFFFFTNHFYFSPSFLSIFYNFHTFFELDDFLFCIYLFNLLFEYLGF